MKTAERVLIKIILIQLFLLLFFQVVIHKLDVFPELNPLTPYEGVNKNTYTEILEVFSKQ